MFLHAAAVSFNWPDTKQPFAITVELPDDLANLLLKLPAAASASVQA
jgi:hypothetical protein